MHTILIYHTISSPDKAVPGDLDIPPKTFERHLRWLSRWRQVVHIDETLTASCQSGNPGSVAITFDDGFRDNLTVALPLLEKFRMPITLFVTAGLVGRGKYLSVEELREIARHPLVTVGAHGLWQRPLTRLSNAEARGELRESRALLKSITGRKIELMAWPSGESNPSLEQLSRECGYRAAWSDWKGTNSSYSRGRVPLGRRDHMARFVAKVSGAYLPTKFLQQQWYDFRNGAGTLNCAELSAF
jgi:peptidoglycan/xylan/chitin deacetylase (PgdA/CDA1 family)